MRYFRSPVKNTTIQRAHRKGTMAWVLGYEGKLLVSKKGDVYSYVDGEVYKRKKVLTQRGYETVMVRVNRKRVNLRVHTLVLEAFVCPRPKNYQANHINGNKSDNSLENLQWVTPAENQAHAIRTRLVWNRQSQVTSSNL